MAFFGLFDYSKPGPGISKDAPKKRGFIEFWEIFFRKFWKLLQVNLLYLVTSIPVVTLGLSNAGLTYITRNFTREKPVFLLSDYFAVIKKNWKQAFPMGIINTLLTLLIAFDIYFFYLSEGGTAFLMMVLVAMFGIFFAFVKYYCYYLMVTFDLSLKQIYKNSLILAFAGLFRNLLLFLLFGVLYVGAGLLLYLYPHFGIPIVLVALFIFPAFRSLLIQFTVFPLIKKHMIAPYYKAHPEQMKDAKRMMNVVVEQEEAEKEQQDPEEEEDLLFHDAGSTEETEPEPKEEKRTLPRQYTEQEMRRLNAKKRSRSSRDEEDDII